MSTCISYEITMAWQNISFDFIFNIDFFLFNIDHLKSKQHKRIVRATDRAAYRQKLNNAIPSLLNTLDLLQTKKISEIENENNEFEIDETIETLENNN